MEKLISLFFLIFVLALLFYVMWAISREYPFELAFRDQKAGCCNYFVGNARAAARSARVTAVREMALSDARLRNGGAA